MQKLKHINFWARPNIWKMAKHQLVDAYHLIGQWPTTVRSQNNPLEMKHFVVEYENDMHELILS